jgi:hypothetical protein
MHILILPTSWVGPILCIFVVVARESLGLR